MNIKILIDSNTNDDWSVTSPFSGYTSTSGFLISNDPSATYGLYTNIPNILLAVGNVNRSVDILDEGNFNKEIRLKGIGGITKVGDWNFEIEDVSEITTPLDLIGRVVSLLIDNVVVYEGRIYRCEPSLKKIKFHVRSNFLLWDKEIGTVLTSDIKHSNNKIYPIVYGDFTTEDSYIPLVMDETSDYTIEGYLGEQDLKEISNIFVWDSGRLKADQSTNGLDDLTIDTGNKKIYFKTTTAIALIQSITGTPDMDTIKLDAMPIIGIKFTTSPTFSVGDLFYTDTSLYGRNYYEYLEKRENAYFFEVGKRDTDIEYIINPEYGMWDTLKPDSSGVLTRVSDSSTYTVDGGNISDVNIPPVYARQPDSEYLTTVYAIGPPLEPGLKHDYNDAMRSRLIQIDDEKMLIHRSLPIWDSSINLYSLHEVFRGYSNTTKATHTPTFIDLKQDVKNNIEHIIKMKTIVPVNALSNWKALFTVSDGTNRTYKPSKTVREMTSSISNLNSFLNNFSYQDTDTNPLTINFADFSGMTFEYTSGFGTFTDIRAVLLLDIELGQIPKIEGYITGIWLLGSYEIDRGAYPSGTNPVGGWDNKITLAMRAAADTDDYKRVGINLYHAYQVGLNPDKEKTGENGYTLDNGYQYFGVLQCIVNYDRSWFSKSFVQYSNNPVFGSNMWEKSFPLFGSWNYITSPVYKYIFGTVEEPRMPRTLDDFYKQHFVLQLHGESGTQFILNNVGFLIEYNIDVHEIPLWVQCKGRVDISDNLLTSPAEVIEDILVDELDIHGSKFDTSSFASAKTHTASQTCAFTLYEQPILASKILNTICKEHGLVLGEVANGDVCLIPINVTTITYNLLDTDILLNSENIAYFEEGFTGVDKLITALTIKYKKRYPDNLFIEQHTSGTDFDDAEDYTDQDREAVIEAETIRDSATATILNDLCINFYKTPLRKLKIHCNPENTMELIPGQIITFATENYVKNTSGLYFLIVETDFQPGYANIDPEVILTLIAYSESAETTNPYQDTDGSSTVWQDTDGTSNIYQM